MEEWKGREGEKEEAGTIDGEVESGGLGGGGRGETGGGLMER